MSKYDAEFESKISKHRRRQQLLVARSLHFRASKSDFEALCRSKLSEPETVQFFWQPPMHPWHMHRGWAMLAFTSRPHRSQAEEELKDLELRGRKIEIVQAKRRIYAPSTQSVAPTTASTTTAPSTAAPSTMATTLVAAVSSYHTEATAKRPRADDGDSDFFRAPKRPKSVTVAANPATITAVPEAHAKRPRADENGSDSSRAPKRLKSFVIDLTSSDDE
ncbi:hypothetical protein BGZ63DRAFT_407171 [Mariannaea sp. PMI_226]|nr:hypothetical protein BGZ63DRAFT_407171 [Mariannaea sp. PMI_226]